MIQSYWNDAEKKFITEVPVKTWLKDIEEVAFDAENVLDELNYHALHNEVKAMKPMMNNALSCFSSFHHMIVRPHQMALTIKKINSSFDSINKRATGLHLQSMFVDAPPLVPDASFETNSFTLDPVFIGRDDAVPELVELMTESPEERKFSILAVVGMGGLGKTTLIRKVFNHQKMKTQFGCHSWIARSVESWPFRRLCRLEIDASVEWSRESSFSIKESVDGILRGCSSSLTELRLVGLEIWDCLPESIQNLTGVWRLELCNFGIEELPEWFGNLSSLMWLTLSRCKKLRHLGGRNALRRLTKLRDLHIKDCPELSFIDSEWRRNNIPHVYIKVDGHEIHPCPEMCVTCIRITPLICVQLCKT